MILNVSPTGGPSTVVTTFAGFAQAVGRESGASNTNPDLQLTG